MFSLTLAFCALAFAQDVSTPLTFDAAEIKINKTNGALSAQYLESGQVIICNITMRLLIAGAWGTRDHFVIGGPSWLDSDRLDLIAKAPAHTSITDFHLMVQSLLIERIHLSVRSDQKEIPVYDLEIDPRAPNSSPSTQIAPTPKAAPAAGPMVLPTAPATGSQWDPSPSYSRE